MPTPVTGQFVDLPAPVQAVRMCSLLLAEHPDECDINVYDSAQCKFGSDADHVVIAVQHAHKPADFTARVTGRPALISNRSLVQVLRAGCPSRSRRRADGPWPTGAVGDPARRGTTG